MTKAATAVEACAAAIRRAVLAGEYKPGDRLPPERALSERLGVNRTTLRAALGRLASARLLAVRQGSGHIVQDYREVAGLELLPELAELAEERGEGIGPMVAELLEVRRRIAAMALERLAERAERGALDPGPIREAVLRFTALVKRDATVDELAEADLDVTAAVLQGTESTVLGLILNPVSFVVRELEPLRLAIYRDPEIIALGHQMLLAWLVTTERAGIPLMMRELERRDAATAEYVEAGEFEPA